MKKEVTVYLSYQPMPGGKGNVQSANPPPDLEPGISAITKTHEAQKEAEDKPGQ